MSRKYKFRDNDKLYFISYAAVYWEMFLSEKNTKVYGSKAPGSARIIRDTKKFTSETIIEAIASANQESRKEWMLAMFKKAAHMNSNNTRHQFWQQHNMPIEITSYEMMQQKLNYIHMNPVVAGFVDEPHHWKYSSAIDYAGGKGLLKIMNIG